MFKVISRKIEPIKIESKKQKFIQYNEPFTKDMAIFLVYFNPCNYNRIIQNALSVKHFLDCAKIPYFISEIKHDSHSNYLFSKSDNVFQYSSNSYMFYKENLITTMEKKISVVFTKICIIDFDIFFDNPDWYSIISNKLNEVQVTQPFAKAHFLNHDFSIGQTKNNCIDAKTTNVINYKIEHTGFIWAFDRKWYIDYEFDDKFATGLGDTIFANNITKRIYNDFGSIFYHRFSTAKKYTEAVHYASCDLNVYHLNHGPLMNRQYSSINKMIFDIFIEHDIKTMDEIFIRRDDNILEWNLKYLKIFNDMMFEYFVNRNDDCV